MIDMPVVDLINGFNKRPYCFTLQSCYGHFVSNDQKDTHNLDPLPAKEIIVQFASINVIRSILNPNGQVLIVEPPFHVSKAAFEAMIRKAENAGFEVVERPKVFLSKTVVLKNGYDPWHFFGDPCPKPIVIAAHGTCNTLGIE
jgi:hypothetical protein